MNNLLIKADNVEALQYLLNIRELKDCIDLVYIDPPFATNSNFTISAGRATTISKAKKGSIAYSDKIIGNDFLLFLKKRLVLIKELLSEQGSIYVHIDYKIGHYVKILMDEIFGIENFRNDITRVKCNPKNFKRVGYGNIKDMILFYSKSAQPIWNEPHKQYSERDIEKLYTKVSTDGRRYTTVPIHAPGETENGESNKAFKGMYPPHGRHWRTDVQTLTEWDSNGLIEWSKTGNPRKIIFADERPGKRVQDIWEFKDPQYPSYPTEKNLDLLNLIIQTSSNEDSIVLDCFCGSGTTLQAAHMNNRRWIGIDRSEFAVQISRERLNALEDSFFCPHTSFEFLELE